MAQSFYPDNAGEFIAWLENFIQVAQANMAELGLVADDITELENLRSDLTEKLNAKVAKREASVAATTDFNLTHKSAKEKVGGFNQFFKSKKNVTSVLLEALGLNANDANLTPIVPVAPSDLVVEGRSNGINYLKFNRNGNKSTVNFVIESKTGDETAYKFVTVTKKTRFQHKNQTPGVRVFYRVKAVNGDFETEFSNEAVVYN